MPGPGACRYHGAVMPRALLFLFAAALAGCQSPLSGSRSGSGSGSIPQPATPPAPLAADAWGGTTGPGGPAVTFSAEDLWQGCSILDGGPDDSGHHNLVVPWDGYLLLPWAPEYSNGGLSFFDVSDPCAPVKVGEGYAETMRESHSVGFATVDGRDYAAVNYHGGIDFEQELLVGGIQIWDVTDATTPVHLVDLNLPEYLYPDSYARVTLSLFWQHPTIYAASADNGVHIIDASDPENPEFVSLYTFDPVLRLGSFHAMGNVAMAASAEGSRTVMMDLSDPLDPQPLPGGEFTVADDAGAPTEYYFSNVGGSWGLFARKEGGGGPIVYDIADPSNPTRLGDFPSGGNGGYVFRQHEMVFVGESSFAAVYDFTDPLAPLQVGVAELEGDLDTATPVGNVVALSVDDDAVDGQATILVPWTTDPDARGPAVGMSFPRDGDTFVRTTSRVGLVFDEMVEPRSVFAGSVRVTDAAGWPVDGWWTAQENVVNFSPAAPLQADATYVVSVPAGGVTDFNGNPTEADWTMRFATGAAVTP